MSGSRRPPGFTGGRVPAACASTNNGAMRRFRYGLEPAYRAVETLGPLRRSGQHGTPERVLAQLIPNLGILALQTPEHAQPPRKRPSRVKPCRLRSTQGTRPGPRRRPDRRAVPSRCRGTASRATVNTSPAPMSVHPDATRSSAGCRRSRPSSARPKERPCRIVRRLHGQTSSRRCRCRDRSR